jgi:hypothetical protein
MRPRSLAEVAKFASEGDSFDRCLANFLDEFYASPNTEALTDAPMFLAPLLGDTGRVEDAYLAATAEELARLFGFPSPAWAANDLRALHKPWFASQLASLRAVLLLESPPAFRARNLFVSENALSRA